MRIELILADYETAVLSFGTRLAKRLAGWSRSRYDCCTIPPRSLGFHQRCRETFALSCPVLAALITRLTLTVGLADASAIASALDTVSVILLDARSLILALLLTGIE